MSCTEKYAVIFDLDGTLLDTVSDLADAVNYAMRAKSMPEKTTDEVRKSVGNGILKLIERCVPEGTPRDEVTDALGIFKDYYNAHMCDKTAPFDGTVTLLKEIRALGIRTAVVSNKHDTAVKKLIGYYFGELIDFTLGKSDGIPAKPDPASLLTAARSIGVSIKNVLYAGDSDVDVYTAHNAGCRCAGAAWGYRSEASLKSAGADFIVYSADELLEIIKNNKFF